MDLKSERERGRAAGAILYFFFPLLEVSCQSMQGYIGNEKRRITGLLGISAVSCPAASLSGLQPVRRAGLRYRMI